MCLVSIIVPIYNGIKYLDRIVRMCENNAISLEQCDSIELIIVNDSPQECIIMRESNLIRIIKIDNNETIGIHASRVAGLKIANGKFVVFLDQDDFIADTFLKSQLETLGDGDVVICDVVINNKPRYKSGFVLSEQINELKYYIEGSSAIKSPGQALIKKMAIPAYWIEYCLNNSGVDDWLLWILMLYEGKKFVYNNGQLFYYSFNESSFSRNGSKMRQSMDEAMHRLVDIGWWTEKDYTERFNNCYLNDIVFQDSAMYQREKMNVLDCILETVWHNKDASMFLKAQNIDSVAIYGMDLLGKHLYYCLQKKGIKVYYFFDMLKICIDGIEQISMGEPIGRCQAIIITPLKDYFLIKNELKKYYDVSFFSIREVLYNMEISYRFDL